MSTAIKKMRRKLRNAEKQRQVQAAIELAAALQKIEGNEIPLDCINHIRQELHPTPQGNDLVLIWRDKPVVRLSAPRISRDGSLHIGIDRIYEREAA